MADKFKDFVSKNKKWLLIGGAALLAVIALVVVIALVAGGGEDPAGTDPTETTAAHTVTVTDGDGNPLEGVGVYVYADATQQELIWYSRTDAQGKVSFTDKVSSSYVAVVRDVPKYYLTQASYPLTGVNTTIALQLGKLEDNMDITLALGDTMLDFSVTASDGTVYTLSELLEQKDAVVLNFWYRDCSPCNLEFPYLQAAYEAYSDKIEILALSPYDKNEDIAAFKEDKGLTFPMAECDAGWENIFGLVYPTTVVIDRNGEICLIHNSYVDETGVFEKIFSFFTAEDYQQTFLEDLSQIPSGDVVDPTQGTADSPIEVGGVSELQVSVEPGQEIYYNLYRASGLIFRLENEHAYVIVDGTKYTPTDGVIELTLTAPDNYTPNSVVFGNSGTAAQTYTATLSSVPGSYGNPFPLTMGDFTASVAAGNAQGVYYLYEVTQPGTVTVECLEVTDGVGYGITLYNLTTYAQHTLEEGGENKVTIEVNAGDTLQVIISTLPNEENEYPAADFRLNAAMEGIACSHENTEVRDTVNAACTADGYTGDTYCTDCNARVSVGTAIPALGHKDGNQDNKCDVCGAATGTCSHSSTELRNKKDATCTSDGYTGNTYCKICGERVSNGKEIPATGHKSELRNQKEATCTAAGYTGDEYCSVCNAKLASGITLTKLAHKDSNNDKKCDSCGAAMGNNTCRHSSTEIRNKKDATCTAIGYTGDTYCKTCGEMIKNGSVIPAYNHSKTEVRNKKSATCSAVGYTGDTYCTLCDAKVSSGTEIPKTAHTPETRNKKNATCTAEGYTGDTYCSVCNALIESGSKIQKTAHTVKSRNKKDATCTASGYTGDTYCSVCGATLSTGTTIPATGHKDRNGDYKCDTCGASTGTPPASTVTYTFTVGHTAGASTEGIVIQLSGSNGTATATVDASGKAVFQVAAGTYTVKVLDAKGYEVCYCPSEVKVSSAYKSNEISFKNAVPDGYVELDGEVVKLLSTGTNTVELKSGALTYFVYKPTKSGTYSFTASRTIGYYNTMDFVNNSTSGTDYDAGTNTFTLNIKESNLGISYVIGVTAPSGVTSGSVTIKRVGDAVVGWEDQDYVPYSGTYTPKDWTFSGGSLRYINISGDADDYKLYLGSDGYYHLNSETGPLLYLNLTGGAYADCALYTMLNSNRPVVQGYVKDENGNIVSKENYNDLVQKYIDCASEGLYPLTEDLVRILKTQNENWYTYVQATNPGINPDIVWMCNICYLP